MSKILALDIGDQWTGIAVSDVLNILARPHSTIRTAELNKTLTQFIQKETIQKVIVGYPQTMKGTESEQTRKVKIIAQALQNDFPTLTFILWDERLSSKRAQETQKGFSKEEKMKEHARAAAFILDSYLTFLKSHSTD